MMLPKYKAVEIRTGRLIDVISLTVYEGNTNKGEVYGTVEDEESDKTPILLDTDKVHLLPPTGFNGTKYNDQGDGEVLEVVRGDIITLFWEDFPIGYYREYYLTGVVEYSEEYASWVLTKWVVEKFGDTLPDEVDGIEISEDTSMFEEDEDVLLSSFDLTDSDNITILSNIYLDKNYDYGYK